MSEKQIHLVGSKNGIRKTPTRKIPTKKITTWNIPAHVFKHSHYSFSIFCFFIVVTAIIDIT